jgi:hemerythrin-like domain-containing protein
VSTTIVTEHLRADHRRLDAIVDNVERSVRDGSMGEASARFEEFAVGLTWHIDVEERFLFPAFEEATGVCRGPTVVMRAEHHEIRRLLGEITSALTVGAAARAHVALGALASVLGPHNLKEELVLYPTTDKALDEAVRLSLVQLLLKT